MDKAPTIPRSAAKLALMLCESMNGCDECPLAEVEGEDCVPMTEEKAEKVLDWAEAQEASPAGTAYLPGG